MRVRLYEVGEASVGFVLREDRFPLELGIEEQTGRLASQSDHAVCRIEELGGQLLFEGLDEAHAVLINDAPLTRGVLRAGDHLQVDGHCYLISYEQTGTAEPVESRYRLSPA